MNALHYLSQAFHESICYMLRAVQAQASFLYAFYRIMFTSVCFTVTRICSGLSTAFGAATHTYCQARAVIAAYVLSAKRLINNMPRIVGRSLWMLILQAPASAKGAMRIYIVVAAAAAYRAACMMAAFFDLPGLLVLARLHAARAADTVITPVTALLPVSATEFTVLLTYVRLGAYADLAAFVILSSPGFTYLNNTVRDTLLALNPVVSWLVAGEALLIQLPHIPKVIASLLVYGIPACRLALSVVLFAVYLVVMLPILFASLSVLLLVMMATLIFSLLLGILCIVVISSVAFPVMAVLILGCEAAEIVQRVMKLA